MPAFPGNDTLHLLKQGLDAYSLRQRVIAENVANTETPGYLARQLRFEELLKESDSPETRLRSTREGHFKTAESSGASPRITEDSDRALDNGINNVSVDLEMAALAEVNLSHKLATRALAVRYQLLRSSIRGRGTP
ncbi:MAG: flagellar basal body rod protein FlgB [Candidatus Krumholzibacteria bacterium]|jgi:flagellar basal-body rod protein FlgB|nr:flagellar basal body rod protein FlgB [Candidatus Krumholzibacteria bacterium]MDP6670014.1 flagellar basal body rod protein FlgB [Candidatus Krumholzibacteria bacterium]MDP6796299.1 flagellar basal body rod protein FlgB [Candidatus Krumholzibacteria bacterium]MDP7020960.1 flagellar basal body rod protein FlgB [Candidatus Krumholzibacteria bacterium]